MKEDGTVGVFSRNNEVVEDEEDYLLNHLAQIITTQFRDREEMLSKAAEESTEHDISDSLTFTEASASAMSD